MLKTPPAPQQCSSSPISGRWGSVDSVVLPGLVVEGLGEGFGGFGGLGGLRGIWKGAGRGKSGGGRSCDSEARDSGAAAQPAALRQQRRGSSEEAEESGGGGGGGAKRAGAGEAEEERHVPRRAHVAARVQRQDAAGGHEVVHEREHALLHLTWPGFGGFGGFGGWGGGSAAAISGPLAAQTLL